MQQQNEVTHYLYQTCVSLMLSLCLVCGVNAKEYTINFNDADISELIKFVADATGQTIIIDPQVKGKVKVISSKAVNEEELNDLFLSILNASGFAAVKSGNVLRVVQRKDARSSPVPTSGGKGGQIVTHVIQLRNIAAAKLIPILRPLVPQQAHMAAYAPSNAIIISDSAANIGRIRDVIRQIDRSASSGTSIVELQHASAEEVVRLLETLEKAEAGKEGGQVRVRLVPDSRTNSILITGEDTERKRVRSLIEHLDAPLEQSGNARVIYLNYADAVALAETLNRVVQNVSKLDGKKKGGNVPAAASTANIEADEATNSLIITADAAIMQNLESIIKRLDIRRPQVLVEAIIVELEAIDNKDFGIEWLFSDESGVYGSSSDGDGTLTNIAGAALRSEASRTEIIRDADGRPVDVVTTETEDDSNLANLAGALAGNVGQVLGVGNLKENGLSFTVLINALQEDTEANILSTPSLLTLDNSVASISVGQNVPFLTGSFTNASGGDGATNPFQTIERQNVGITLNVTPQINEGDSVILEIEQEVSSLTGAVASDIITNERTISATVLAKDNEIIVLGGLIKDEVQESVRKVPVLGDIPVIGSLFRSEGTSVNKTNLYVFIRPRIIRDSATMSGATAEKYKYIRTQQLNKRLRGVNLVPNKNLPLLPEWEEQMQRLRDNEAAPIEAPIEEAPQQPEQQPR
ncbi:MAG: type II secretion system secretin GspD [Pseudomonadales bacterium]